MCLPSTYKLKIIHSKYHFYNIYTRRESLYERNRHAGGYVKEAKTFNLIYTSPSPNKNFYINSPEKSHISPQLHNDHASIQRFQKKKKRTASTLRSFNRAYNHHLIITTTILAMPWTADGFLLCICIIFCPSTIFYH